MGYRSDVYIAIEKSAYDMVAVLILGTPDLLQVKDCVHVAKGNMIGDDTTTYYWEIKDVKWYAEYPDVMEVDNFLAELGNLQVEHSTNDKYQFIRIGEQLDDIEQEGDWDYGLEPYVGVNVPY